MSGLLPHPSNCTKFLQCAHGGTFIMDCGPGTVFNPAVSVCDWPYNVKGCEGKMIEIRKINFIDLIINNESDRNFKILFLSIN